MKKYMRLTVVVIVIFLTGLTVQATTTPSFFEGGLAVNQDIDDSLLMLALVYQTQGEMDAALEQYQKYLKRNPEEVWVQVLIGDIQKERGYFEEAALAYQTALESGDYAKGFYGMARILFVKAQYEEAIVALKTSLEIAPNYVKARLLLGQLYYLFQDYDEAYEELSLALQYNPFVPMTHYYLGLVYEQQGEMERAVHAWERALQLDPHYQRAVRKLDH